MPRQKHLTRRGALQRFPGLRQDALVGAVQYYDAQADDARHTFTVVRTAAHYGAVVRGSTEVVEMLREADRVVGAVVRDVETGQTQQVRAKVVVNATGVWTDDLQRLAGGRGRFRVRASKGVHLVVHRDRIAGEVGLILRTEKSVLFVIPWGQRWIIGTTDTDWTHDLAHPAATAADIDYVLEHVNAVLSTPITRDDVLGVYAGLRPLLAGEDADTSRLSREHAVARPQPGLVSVAGGKYTTYRVMAADAVDAAAADLGTGVPPSVTEHVPLVGAEGFAAMRNLTGEPGPRARAADLAGRAPARALRLAARRGARARPRRPLAARAGAVGAGLPARRACGTRRPTRRRCTSTTCWPAAPGCRSRRGTAGWTRRRRPPGWSATCSAGTATPWPPRSRRTPPGSRPSGARSRLDDDAASDAARREAPESRPGLRHVTATR
ncbi:hypothetical protein GCM10025868_18130 [Angustibacter aerolatus]|uniref:FAD dependent oxidoreductase domain-containing protein n=1 Tax=Angustibacter aerolatus TaxID=1162965 RepID=A0ABQ6JEH8_9ACTN|nr:hypothetical protein GCM10025868_18130 [Angustibacter aerolatus]